MLAPPRTQPIVRRKLTYAPGSLELTTLAIYTFRTKLGWMALAAEHELIHGLTFGHENQFAALRAIERIANPAELAGVSTRPVEIRKMIEALTVYASGQQVDFQEARLSTSHLTRFGEEVTKRCRQIAWSETQSYQELAAACGRPKAARAVGNVMRNNRFPIIVPCHRVLATGGGLGGYSAPQGISMKQRLLEMEGWS